MASAFIPEDVILAGLSDAEIKRLGVLFRRRLYLEFLEFFTPMSLVIVNGLISNDVRNTIASSGYHPSVWIFTGIASLLGTTLLYLYSLKILKREERKVDAEVIRITNLPRGAAQRIDPLPFVAGATPLDRLGQEFDSPPQSSKTTKRKTRKRTRT